MTIWKTPLTPEEINHKLENTMDGWIGVRYTEVGNDYVKGEMEVDHRTMQPFGIMHGGASCVLAESIGSIAGNMCVDEKTHYCVGQSIHTNHISKAPLGTKLIGIAKSIHLGKTSQLWEVTIENLSGKLISITRLQLAVMSR